MGKAERLTVFLPSTLVEALDRYVGELHIESISQTIEVFLISYVMNVEKYQTVDEPILVEDKMVSKTYSISAKASSQIRDLAKERNTSISECVRLAIYYGLRAK